MPNCSSSNIPSFRWPNIAQCKRSLISIQAVNRSASLSIFCVKKLSYVDYLKHADRSKESRNREIYAIRAVVVTTVYEVGWMFQSRLAEGISKKDVNVGILYRFY